jgi:hypothetical protein
MGDQISAFRSQDKDLRAAEPRIIPWGTFPKKPGKLPITRARPRESTACGDIGSILVNDVIHCRDVSGDVADCVDRISTSSKLPVTLSK